jgi:hypothetical protein
VLGDFLKARNHGGRAFIYAVVAEANIGIVDKGVHEARMSDT